jgi:hypothetical protein
MNIMHLISTVMLIGLFAGAVKPGFSNLISYNVTGFTHNSDYLYPLGILYNMDIFGTMTIEDTPDTVIMPESASSELYPRYKFDIKSFNFTIAPNLNTGTPLNFAGTTGQLYCQTSDELLEFWGAGAWDYWSFDGEPFQIAKWDSVNETVFLHDAFAIDYNCVLTRKAGAKIAYTCDLTSHLQFNRINDTPEPSTELLLSAPFVGLLLLMVRRKSYK